jgi:hypothetical protein
MWPATGKENECDSERYGSTKILRRVQLRMEKRREG